MNRIIAGLIFLVIIIVIAVAFIVPNKDKTSVVVPELQNAPDRTGYIKGLTQEDELSRAAFDVMQIYFNNQAGEEAAQDGVELTTNYYIRDLNADQEMLIIDPKVDINLRYWSGAPLDKLGQATKVSLDEFKTDFLANPERYARTPFEIKFNDNGLISKIVEIDMP